MNNALSVDQNSSEDPREIPIPKDRLSQIELFARQLAWGVFHDMWVEPFVYVGGFWSIETMYSKHQEDFEHLVMGRWASRAPAASLLVALDYLRRNGNEYHLTSKAIGLLEKPVKPPEIFISYSRRESSAFALLIEARLKIAGVPKPFIDKDIPGGEKWEELLKERIAASKYFVCLVGLHTLDSEWVGKEIEWAGLAGCRIITVCHNGQTLGACPTALSGLHGYEIPQPESAARYEAAANFVLNSCGYQTY